MPYSIGTNQPGYLPDTEPRLVGTYSEAVGVLLSEVVYDLELASEDHAEMKELEQIKIDLLVRDRSEGPFIGYANNRAYWIEEVSDEDYEDYRKEYLY